MMADANVGRWASWAGALGMVTCIVFGAIHCGSKKGFADNSPNQVGDASPEPQLLSDGGEPCVGMQCQQVRCENGETTVTGTAYAPNGTLPLYNVIVYVPQSKLDPLPKGATCDKCGAAVSGAPIVSALSD